MDIQMGVATFDSEEGTIQIPVVQLVLSERNLRTLLVNINEKENTVARMTESGFLLQIAAEPNDVHYKDRPAGLMDEKTENELIREELGGDDNTLFLPPDFGKDLN